jgi:hypothetical protein
MCFGQIWQIDLPFGEQLWRKQSIANDPMNTIDTELLDRLHNVTIINPPMNLLSFMHYAWFREFLQERTRLISLTETDASAIMPIIEQIGVPVINQMVSWQEGTSFYTCPFGNMHFLDFLFAVQDDKIIDFLNMAPGSGQSGNPDQIVPSGPLTTCQCGVVYRPYRFQWCAVKSIVDYGGRTMDPTAPSVLLVDTISKCAFFQIVQQADPSVFALHVDKPLDEHQMTIVKNFCIRLFKHTVQIELRLEPFYVGENKKAPVFWSLASRV